MELLILLYLSQAVFQVEKNLINGYGILVMKTMEIRSIQHIYISIMILTQLIY